MITRIKRCSYFFSAASFAYTVWYMHFEKPWTNAGAISAIGVTHRFLFLIWGILVCAALMPGIIAAYRTYHKTRLYVPLLAVSGIGMALTLGCRFQYIHHTEYILHCIGSLTFSIVTSVTVFLLFLLGWKKHTVFKILTVLTAVITLSDAVLLCTVQETGLIEAVPIWAGLIMLIIINTGSEKYDTARKTAETG